MNNKNTTGNFPSENDTNENSGVFNLHLSAAEFANALRHSGVSSEISDPFPARKNFKLLADQKEVKGTDHVVYTGSENNNRIQDTDDVDAMIGQWNSLIAEKTESEQKVVSDYQAYLVEEQAERVRLSQSFGARRQARAENVQAAKIAQQQTVSQRAEAMNIAIETNTGSVRPAPIKTSFFASVKHSAANVLNQIWEGRSIEERDAGFVAERGLKTLLRNTVKLFNPIPERISQAPAPTPAKTSSGFKKRAASFAFAALGFLATGGVVVKGMKNHDSTSTSSSLLTFSKDAFKEAAKAQPVEAPVMPETPAPAEVVADAVPVETLPSQPQVAPAPQPRVVAHHVKTAAKTVATTKTAEVAKTPTVVAEGDKTPDAMQAAKMLGSLRGALKELDGKFTRIAASSIRGVEAASCEPDEKHVNPNIPMLELDSMKKEIGSVRGLMIDASNKVEVARTNDQFVQAGNAVLDAGKAVTALEAKRNELNDLNRITTANGNTHFASAKIAAAQKLIQGNEAKIFTATHGTSKTEITVNLEEVQKLVRSLPNNPRQILAQDAKKPVKATTALNTQEAVQYHQATLDLNKLANDTLMSVSQNREAFQNACLEVLKTMNIQEKSLSDRYLSR